MYVCIYTCIYKGLGRPPARTDRPRAGEEAAVLRSVFKIYTTNIIKYYTTNNTQHFYLSISNFLTQ